MEQALHFIFLYMEKDRMRNFRIDDLSKFSGVIPEGLLNRMATIGGIPCRGPGCKSIPRIFQMLDLPRPIEQTKTQRRQWNMNNRLNKR